MTLIILCLCLIEAQIAIVLSIVAIMRLKALEAPVFEETKEEGDDQGAYVTAPPRSYEELKEEFRSLV